MSAQNTLAILFWCACAGLKKKDQHPTCHK